MTRHTQGPWACDGDNYVYQGVAFNPKNPTNVVCVCSPVANTYEDRARAKADARLISNAPELLSVLEDLARAYTQLLKKLPQAETDESFTRAHAIILKAKGD